VFVLLFLHIDSLAYITAKTNGLDDVADDVADEVLEATGLTKADIDDVPTFGTSSLKPPPVVTCTTNLNWPSVSIGEIFFDRNGLYNEVRPPIRYLVFHSVELSLYATTASSVPPKIILLLLDTRASR
jgi:hypothetical protein